MRCLLIGNYGVGNAGDELLRKYFLYDFPTVEWVVVSAHPSANEVARLPFGLRSFLSCKWIKTLRTYGSVDAVVFGGGSLWTDVESVLACCIWTLHVLPALLLRKPIFLAFQGIGPFHTKIGERLARFVVRHATFVSVRDEASAKRIEKWSLNRKIVQTFDPVFSSMEKQKINQNIKNVCTIIPRSNSSDALMNAAISVLRIHPYIHHVQILLMQPDDAGEQAIAVRLQRELGLPATIIPMRNLRDLMKGVGGSTMIITQRFHGALAALASGIEVDILSQGDGDKLSELRDRIVHGFTAATANALVAQGENALRSAMGL